MGNEICYMKNFINTNNNNEVYLCDCDVILGQDLIITAPANDHEEIGGIGQTGALFI